MIEVTKMMSRSLTEKTIYVTAVIIGIYLLIMSLWLIQASNVIKQIPFPTPSLSEIFRAVSTDTLRQHYLQGIRTLLISAIELAVGFVSILVGLLGFIKGKNLGVFLLFIYALYFLLNARIGAVEIILNICALLLSMSSFYWLFKYRTSGT